MADKQANVTLRRDRRGIEYRGESIEGFPHDSTMTPADQLRVARWAKQLAPVQMTAQQRALIAHQPQRKVSPHRREGLKQDEALRSPFVRGLWRGLDEPTQALVLNPNTTLQRRYPLRTNELAQLTGLSRRQVQHWSDRGLLPHWTDEHGSRYFEAPAAIIAFALRDRKQHERQFYADIASHDRPLVAVRDALNIVGMRTLDLAEDADPQDLADTEQTARAIAEGINKLLAGPAKTKRAGRAKSASRA